MKLGPIVPNDTAFVDAFERFRTNANALARYMLLAIERALMGQPEPELVPNSDVDQVNLEHILPRNAKQAEWPNFSTEEVGVFSLRFGNLTLLKKTENGKIGNKGWDVKRPIIASSTLELNKTAAESDSWGKSEIDGRQKALAIVAAKVWALQP